MRKPPVDKSQTSATLDDLHVRGQSVACPHDHLDDDGGPVRRDPESETSLLMEIVGRSTL